MAKLGGEASSLCFSERESLYDGMSEPHFDPEYAIKFLKTQLLHLQCCADAAQYLKSNSSLLYIACLPESCECQYYRGED